MLCFDLMETIGTEVESIRYHNNLKNHNDIFSICVRDLNTLFRESQNLGYDFTRGKYFDGETWVGDFNPNTMVESCVSPVSLIIDLVYEQGVEVELLC